MSNKVSIIMGIYNCENTLGKSIESILSQTYENWQLVMCDDGSKDNTYKIAKEYEAKDNRIKVLKNECNKGLAFSLNNCINNSEGEYIARQDADDYSDSKRLEKQVEFLNNNKEYDFVGTACYFFDESGIWGERICSEKPEINELIKHNPFIHPTMMIRKSAINKVGKYTVEDYTYRTEDYDLWFKLYKNNFKGYNLSEKLFYFREDKESYSRKKYSYRVDEYKMKRIWFSKLNLSKKDYIFVVKPLIVGLVPNFLIRKYKNNKWK